MRIQDFRRMLPEIRQAIQAQVQVALTEAAEKIAETAREELGHQQDGWPPLAEATERSKHQKGEDGGPLIATGALKESIKVHVEPNHAVIGTDEKYAEYLEGGTEKMPPRPFLSKAAMANAEEIERLFALALQRAFSTGS